MSDRVHCPSCERKVEWNVPHRCDRRERGQITPERAMSLYLEGLSYSQIAKRVGVTKPMVQHAMAKARDSQ